VLDPTDPPATPATPATPPLPGPGGTNRSAPPDGFGDAPTSVGVELTVDHGAAAPEREPDDGTGRVPTGSSAAGTRRPFMLDTRPDWTIAVRHEDARHVRYGRPVSVLLLELTGEADGEALDRIAHGLADLIRDQARATDRAVRFAAGSFRILMPETGERPARAAAARLAQAYRAAAPGRSGEELRIEVATPAQARSLQDALADAEAQLRSAHRIAEPASS
jgi:hypothetical protein